MTPEERASEVCDTISGMTQCGCEASGLCDWCIVATAIRAAEIDATAERNEQLFKLKADLRVVKKFLPLSVYRRLVRQGAITEKALPTIDGARGIRKAVKP